mmetsp:Transcript_18143/g.41480  ORF Transcript_18143/g.41480 Transcript_18143/m.41480 type:complete len:225 (-) Transcript_18143:554-1228(-)
MARYCLPGSAVDRAGKPSVLVDGSVAQHLEVLYIVTLGFVFGVKRIGEARSLNWALLDAADRLRWRNSRDFVNRRCHIDYMGELRTHLALCGDARRPMRNHAVANTTKVRGHLFGVGERRIQSNGPACRIVRVGLGTSPIVEVGQHTLNLFGYPIEEGVLIKHSVAVPLRARPIIPRDINEEGVVELARVLKRSKQATNLVIRVRCKGSINLHLAREEPLLIRA